jgi:hypothetical protein
MPKKENGERCHIKDLVPDPANLREHGERNIAMIEKSLETVGAARSIVIDEGNRILAGNGVVEGAGNIGMENVRIIDADGQELIAVRRRGLTEEQKTALAIADNRAGELSTWAVGALMKMPREVTATWFSEKEMQALAEAGQAAEKEQGADGSLVDLTDVTFGEPKHKVEPGECWSVGKHMLVCGEVLTGWAEWKNLLEGEDTLFAPYCGPFTPLTLRADKVARVVMVQPDPFICGHILDRWAEVKGEGTIKRSKKAAK